MATEAPILVGLRLADEYRRRNWAYARSRWEAQLGWPLIEGHYDEPGPYCMAVASNRAYRSAVEAGDWDVLFYIGADFLLRTGGQAQQAVDLARRSGQLTFAHNNLVHLAEDETKRVIGADVDAIPATEQEEQPNTFSGALAVPRKLWEKVGGFDERFVDWGWEDLSFWSACWALGGGFKRVSGVMYHLWHPRSHEQNEGNPSHEANQVLGRRYLAARTNPTAMTRILCEPGGPLGR